jgi:RNA polymerase sigma-70 factor (ECF subfamily)
MSADAAFVNQLRCGEAAAWDQLATTFRHRLRSAAALALPRDVACRADASDVVQQTLAEANQSFAEFRGNSLPELFEWLCAILDHNVKDTIREHLLAQRRSVKSEFRLDDSSEAHAKWNGFHESNITPPSEAAQRGELRERISTALNQLPARQHAAVRLRHLQGRPLDEIAAELECSKQAAAAIIARGLRGLRAALSDIS